MLTVVGHFVLFPREREKRDRRDSRDERDGQGRKRKINKSEEREEIHFPSTLICCKDSSPYPIVSQYQLDARGCKIHDTFASPNHHGRSIRTYVKGIHYKEVI